MAILILDFGSQYTQLIARRVREMGVYCELWPFDVDPKRIIDFAPQGIILSGGPETVTAQDTPRIPDLVLELGCPILGICYGMQALALQLGGQVESSDKREFGYAKIQLQEKQEKSALFLELAEELEVWMSHGDKVTVLPPDFLSIAYSENTPIAAMAHSTKKIYAVQFHPEVTHTPQGMQMLTQFVMGICGCEANWTPASMVEEAVQLVQKRVGKETVLVGLSGGVDSAVVAALLHKAIGAQLVCVFVDTGLLRKNEGDQVMQVFAEHLGVKVIRVNAGEEMLGLLKGVIDPEEKRKIIGAAFIRIFEREAKKLKNIRFLGQGTIYPDVIESAKTQGGKAHVIKSHHNVGGLPDDLAFDLIEPLRFLFKDEVRKMGLQLGLPASLVFRHPFPGPGLALRILGEVKLDYIHILQEADAIFMEELRKSGWYDKTSQAFVVFLPVKSVGVKGDARSYEYVVALRAVETTDFMTAHAAELPYALLSLVTHRIINEVPQISRVVYDISGKPPATIEWE